MCEEFCLIHGYEFMKKPMYLASIPYCTECDRMTEKIFTCRRCEANYEVGHLEQPVTECPVCSAPR